ncbi:hypothetical protein [Polaribacter sp. R77954]|uniref:hypothetical protein n=1 Tax=Polaribacter sp. R77954 TaxID=3093870 RepID=UPI0037C9DD1C
MKHITYIVIILVLGMFLLNQCTENAKSRKRLNLNIEAVNDTVEYFKSKISDLEIAHKETFFGTKKELDSLLDIEKAKNKELTKILEDFKRPDNITKVNSSLKIDSIKIPFDKKIKYVFNRPFIKENEHFHLSGNVNEFGLYDVKFQADFQQSIVTGLKKTGFLQEEYRTEIINTNPFITTEEISNFNILLEKEKNKRIGVGFSFGFGVYSNGFFVGPSIHYSIKKF